MATYEELTKTLDGEISTLLNARDRLKQLGELAEELDVSGPLQKVQNDISAALRRVNALDFTTASTEAPAVDVAALPAEGLGAAPIEEVHEHA